MLKNYFTIAWRNITRHKVYTAINVFGLALGICACIVIYLITNYEFSFDRLHPDGDRIYRIVGEMKAPSGQKDFVHSPFSDVAGFEHQIPGYEAAAFHTYGASISIPDGNKPLKKFENKIAGSYASSTIITWPNYFKIFRYDWLAGNPSTALNDPYKVVLTEKRAHQYFGDLPLNEMIGKTVIYDDSLQVAVSGIVKDWKGNTDLGYTDFISISTAQSPFLKDKIPTQDWNSLRPHQAMAFVKLLPGTTAQQINARFAAFIKKNVKLDLPGASLSMWLQPLTSIHFTNDFHRGDDGDNFRKPYLPTLYVLMALALFILIIAAVNFVNLSTAQSMQRAKEVGMRKVMGSNRKNIILQFLTETLVLTLFAVSLSVLLVKPVLAAFSSFIPEGVQFHPSAISTVIFLATITLVTTLLAGFYPAKILAAYQPVESLKGGASTQTKGHWNLRKSLIVFQFTISLIFIMGAIIIGKQIRFMNSADKGFNTDAIITVNNWNDHEGKLKVFAENIKKLPGVYNTVLQGNAPMGFAQSIDNYKYKGKDELNFQVSAQIGNEDFIPFYKMKLIAGRNMLHSDSLNEVVINETFARALGFTKPQDAVGKLLYQQFYQGEKPYPIAGVVADFHTGSFHEPIKPTIIENVPDRKFSVAIKLATTEQNAAQIKATLSQVEAEWKKIFPETPFDYSFLNESISWLYGQEEKTAWLINVAMCITIFISCMGLFGLAMFTAERRTKEIGIRKVLGASVANITAMLSKDFVILVAIAILIASPIAAYLMNQWLQDFVYRTNISWWIFMLAGFSAVIIALITVSFQAIKAALINPVKSLRSE